MIPLPALTERTAGERLRFIKLFLQAEASKIGVDVVIPQESLRMLLEYECLGNIGQLRNDIQLACARLFLSYLTQRREPMELLPGHLPEHIHRTVPPVRHRSAEVTDLLSSTGGRMVVTKRTLALHPDAADDESADESMSFYGLIEQQVKDLQRRGMSPAEAEQTVLRNVEGHFKDFVGQVRHRHQVQRQELTKLVGPDILRAVERAPLWAEERLGRALPERIVYALALHIHATLERVEQGRGNEYDIHLPESDGSPEAPVAAGVVALLSRELCQPLPASDVAFVTMLLRPEGEAAPASEQVGVVVVAHGRVASAMVDVAHALAGVSLAAAIDMPLDEEPAVVQEHLVAMAREGQFPGGLLLLVDMGSLEAMGEAVTQHTGVQVRTIGMVSSPLVVEAVHQASMPGATLDLVYQSVLTARGAYLGKDYTESLPQVILTFCFTGVGSAHTLARFVREALPPQAQRVEIIPTSIGTGTGWSRLVNTLLRSHRLLAVVGPMNPRIPGIPYISTEEMVVGKGARRLRQLVDEGTTSKEPSPSTEEASVFVQMAASLGEHLKVTNPTATIPVVLKALRAIEQYMGRALEDALRIGLTMQLVCLLDRKVRERLMQDERPSVPDTTHQGSCPWLPDALREFTSTFHVRLSNDELERLDEIICESVSAQPLSKTELRRAAATTPAVMPARAASVRAVKANSNVLGSLAPSSRETRSWVRSDLPRSPVRAFPAKTKYWESRGLSRPISRRTCSTCSAVAASPTMARAGSPGARRTALNTRNEAPISTGMIASRRRRMYLYTVFPRFGAVSPEQTERGGQRARPAHQPQVTSCRRRSRPPAETDGPGSPTRSCEWPSAESRCAGRSRGRLPRWP